MSKQQICIKIGFLNNLSNEIDQEVEGSFPFDNSSIQSEDDWNSEMKKLLSEMLDNVIPTELSKTEAGLSIFNNKHNYTLHIHNPQIVTMH